MTMSSASAASSSSTTASTNTTMPQHVSMQVAYNAFLAEAPITTSPVDFVRTIIPEDYFSPEQADYYWNAPHQPSSCSHGYTNEVVNAIRQNDLVTLRRLVQNGQTFDYCNANGEYLLHLACRRAQPATVEFLLQSGATATVRDRQGRTILHDVCWKSQPDLPMMQTVLRLAPPELLLAKDGRGHTPFDFARKQHSAAWKEFLDQHADDIQGRLFAQYFTTWLQAECAHRHNNIEEEATEEEQLEEYGDGGDEDEEDGCHFMEEEDYEEIEHHP